MSVDAESVDSMLPADLLAFEAAHPRPTSEKHERIRRELGITPVRFYQLLHRAVDTREAIEADPITARRVRDRLDRVRA